MIPGRLGGKLLEPVDRLTGLATLEQGKSLLKRPTRSHRPSSLLATNGPKRPDGGNRLGGSNGLARKRVGGRDGLARRNERWPFLRTADCGRRTHRRSPRLTCPPVNDRPRKILHLIPVEDLLRRLGVPHHEPASVDERLVETVDDPLDSLLLEVDEDVAAHHEVHAVGDVLGRRVVVVHEVEARELHHPADLRRELEVVLVEAGEVLLLHVLRHLAEGPVAVEARVRLLERSVVDVRAVDQHVPLVAVGKQAVDQDGERVRLLTGRAGRAPDAEPARLAPGLDQRRKDLGLERLHLRPVAEEMGLVDGDGGHHRLERGRAARSLLGEQLVERSLVGGAGALQRGAHALLQVGLAGVGDLDARSLADDRPVAVEIRGAEREVASPSAHRSARSCCDPAQTRSRSKIRMRRSPARATASTALVVPTRASGGSTDSSGTVRSSVTESAMRPTIWPSCSATMIGVLIPTGLLARPSRTRRSITGITLPRRLMTPGSQLGASGTGAMATMRRISPTLPTGRAYSDFSMRKTTSWVAVAEPASVSLRAGVVMVGVIGGPKRFFRPSSTAV